MGDIKFAGQDYGALGAVPQVGEPGEDDEMKGEEGGLGGGGGVVGGGVGGGGSGSLIPLTQVITQTIIHQAKDMKIKDRSEADSRADSSRQDLQERLLGAQAQSDQDLALDVITQEVNTQKVLSTPGIWLYDSDREMKFIRNTRGDVVRKEYFIYEHYLRDEIKIWDVATEEGKGCRLKYSVKIKADKGLLSHTPQEMSEEICNWKLFHNKWIEFIILASIIGTVAGAWILEDKLSYFGIVGLFLAGGDVVSVIYFRCHGIEGRFNRKSMQLFMAWRQALAQFGDFAFPGYVRKDNALAFIEIVERPLVQRKIVGRSQRETDDLEKVGFGKTTYGVKIYSPKSIVLAKKHTLWDLLVPIALFILQTVVLIFAFNHLEDLGII